MRCGRFRTHCACNVLRIWPGSCLARLRVLMGTPPYALPSASAQSVAERENHRSVGLAGLATASSKLQAAPSPNTGRAHCGPGRPAPTLQGRVEAVNRCQSAMIHGEKTRQRELYKFLFLECSGYLCHENEKSVAPSVQATSHDGLIDKGGGAPVSDVDTDKLRVGSGRRRRAEGAPDGGDWRKKEGRIDNDSAYMSHIGTIRGKRVRAGGGEQSWLLPSFRDRRRRAR
ncbi:hypothetical protein C8Q74DRAFT_637210 [Fomes fomentarius]|nr:hypothetical protein C8Q74DRAFT_637210 [Fomes fomentarius]